jgi:hypothetical protein
MPDTTYVIEETANLFPTSWISLDEFTAHAATAEPAVAWDPHATVRFLRLRAVRP